MDDAGHASQVHLVIVAVERIVKVLLQQPLVTATNSDDVVAQRKRGRADPRIQAFMPGASPPLVNTPIRTS